jgi:hypothetical protein
MAKPTLTDFERRILEDLAAGCAERSVPRMDLNAIAHRAAAKNIAVAGALDRLEAKGLVAKNHPCPYKPGGSRSALWAIRPEGRAWLEAKASAV